LVKKGKELPRCDEDSIHGIVYIAAENYMHALIDALSEIENEFQNVYVGRIRYSPKTG
jgi:hypothetical protein